MVKNEFTFRNMVLSLTLIALTVSLCLGSVYELNREPIALSILNKKMDAKIQVDSSLPLQTGIYLPTEQGYKIRIEGNTPASSSGNPTRIGETFTNPRLHRRPLFPPANKSFIWNSEELKALERSGFRPLIIAYHEPRFLFDFHSAGGLLGHLFLGISRGNQSKWFHDWKNIQISYSDGRMDYVVDDPDFPGLIVRLSASPLAGSAGLILKVEIEGISQNAELVWTYGGASGFFTNYNMTAPEFSFSPEQCQKDSYTLQKTGFLLERAFHDSEPSYKEVFSAARKLPGWKAHVQGGSSWKTPVGLGDPNRLKDGPSSLLEQTRWGDSAKKSNIGSVVIQRVQLGSQKCNGFIIIGMGGDIQEAIEKPGEAWKDALGRNQSIANRIIVHTPDLYLNAAARMMAFATEGTWGDLAVLHGGWSWRFAYLGWRGWYGSTCYGWEDRIRKSIRNHIRLGVVREGDDQGGLGSLLENDPGIYYNMNEVFFDQVRQYFDYTGDITLMREIYPILKGIAAWEDRRLQPEQADLYENALNTWISDSHWYTGGQCTQASAYMYRAYSFLGELAKKLGEDPAQFDKKAALIYSAAQQKLWQPDQGIFAEYLDTRGNRMLHPEPELPTLYHSTEFGLADPEQINSMMDWAVSHIRTENTPGPGKLVWSSNWAPNNGRSYTHSTYELAYGENLNFALANWQAGRFEDAYALMRGVNSGIFNGPTPGGLSCHAYENGTQRANDEFTDPISMWGRALVEGLFGVAPKMQDNTLTFSPQFPMEWKEASIKTPHISYNWEKDRNELIVSWNVPDPLLVIPIIPLRTEKIMNPVLKIDGQSYEPVYEMNAGLNGYSLFKFISPKPSRRGKLIFHFETERPAPFSSVSRLPVQLHHSTWISPDTKSQDLALWYQINLSSVFNAKLTEVLPHIVKEVKGPALPASQVGFGYWKDHLLRRNKSISDSAWRAKTGANGTAWTGEGIPFLTSKDDSNIAMVMLFGPYPESIQIPVGSSGKTLYLMISGMTFPSQSHVPNLRVILYYKNGTKELHDLVNPFDIGDCWSTWCGRFHDTAANGFENIGGRRGPASSRDVPDLTQPIDLDTEAQLIAFPLQSGEELASVTIKAVANDVLFGIMGATIHR